MNDRPDYINRIKPFIGLEPVKVLTGLRRSGKSVMLKLIQKELMASVVPTEVFWFFDEVQEVQDWEKCINSLRVE